LSGAWRLEAACRGAPLDVFFPDNGEDAGPARQCCGRCLVHTQCLEEALAWPAVLDYGIWTSTTPRERGFLRWLARQAKLQAAAKASGSRQLTRSSNG